MTLSPRLGLSVGAWVTSVPAIAPSAVLHLGLLIGPWWAGLRGEVAWPQTQTVDVSGTGRSGTLTSVSFAVSALFGRCFVTGALELCPAVTFGARVLQASSQGQLYQLKPYLAAVPALGLDGQLAWHFSSQFALLLHLSPTVPLGQVGAAVEGTTAEVRSGAVEGVVGVGLLWSPRKL